MHPRRAARRDALIGGGGDPHLYAALDLDNIVAARAEEDLSALEELPRQGLWVDVEV